ncbi:MAG: periplasmic heavy metal sensor [Bacteroidia bacterium]
MRTTGNTRWAAIAIISLIVLNLGTLTFMVLQNGGRPLPGRGMGKNDPVYIFFRDEIGFDEAQFAQFDQLRVKNRAEMKEYNDQMRKLKDTFFRLMASEIKDQAAVDSLATSIGQLQTNIDLTVFEHFSSLREICTDKQKGKFDLLIDDLLRRNRPPQGHMPGGRR